MTGVASFKVERDVAVPMRDGATLRADLWLPNGAAPAAAILFRTPYGKSLLNPDLLKPQACVEAGFAAVVQDTRGRFASGGAWKPGMWAEEAIDTYDTVEWIAAQPWCSGAVGMSGPSYLGITQLVGAALKPPHLKAIAPAMATVAELDRADTGGCVRLDHYMSWTAFMAVDWMQREGAAGRALAPNHVRTILDAVKDPHQLMEQRPLSQIELFKIPGFPISFEELTSGTTDIPGLDWAALDLPVLLVGGWYDIFCGGTVGGFSKLIQHNPAHQDQYHLLMGCWTHAGCLPQYHGQVNFGLFAAAGTARVPDYHLAFFRKYLRGESQNLPAVRYFVMNANEWRDESQWPPPTSATERLYLHREGQLGPAAPSTDESSTSYVYDPADPTPTIGGRVLYVGGLAMGPIDQRSIADRSDVIHFTGAATEKAFDIVGVVTAHLAVSSSAPDTDFMAKLIDVAPDGLALPVCEGALRMRWRHGFTALAPALQVDKIERVVIDCGSVAWRVLAGHRLRLQVQSANYPHLDPNMNTGNAPGADAVGVSATNAVHHDQRYPSWIELSTGAVS